MKKTISYEFAKYLGLIDNPYEKRKVGFYSGQYILEGRNEAERRREIAEIGAKKEIEAQMRLPNCVDKDLMLFEFEEETILKYESREDK